jgi:hypothetical protein
LKFSNRAGEINPMAAARNSWNKSYSSILSKPSPPIWERDDGPSGRWVVSEVNFEGHFLSFRFDGNFLTNRSGDHSTSWKDPKHPGIGPVRIIKVTTTNLGMRMMDSSGRCWSFLRAISRVIYVPVVDGMPTGLETTQVVAVPGNTLVEQGPV